MAKLRFVADEPHLVPVLGRTVEPDELVEVPADVFKAHEWPESIWSVQSTTKGKE